jgi:ribonuclease HI
MTTNNVMELTAAIKALQWLWENETKKQWLWNDSDVQD